MRSMKDWAFEGIRKAGYPLVLTDDYGIRFVLYPWNKTPTWKLRGRQNMSKEFAAFKKLIPKEGAVIDVGANIGIHTTMMSRYAKKVYAFEPTEESYRHLKENLALNQVDNVLTIPKAVSSKDGVATFHLFHEGLAEWNTLQYRETSEVKPQSTRKVTTITLDSFAKEQNIGMIDFIKIDVEGNEKEVLEGARQLLNEKRIKAFSFEIWNEGQGGSVSADTLIAFIESFGYQVKSYDQDRNEFYAISRPYLPTLHNDNLYAFPN